MIKPPEKLLDLENSFSPFEVVQLSDSKEWQSLLSNMEKEGRVTRFPVALPRGTLEESLETLGFHFLHTPSACRGEVD
jgi:hypothetical protein